MNPIAADKNPEAAHEMADDRVADGDVYDDHRRAHALVLQNILELWCVEFEHRRVIVRAAVGVVVRRCMRSGQLRAPARELSGS